MKCNDSVSNCKIAKILFEKHLAIFFFCSHVKLKCNEKLGGFYEKSRHNKKG